jgi:hypothetical protein
MFQSADGGFTAGTPSHRRLRITAHEAQFRDYLRLVPSASSPVPQPEPIGHSTCSGLVLYIWITVAAPITFPFRCAYCRRAADLKMLCISQRLHKIERQTHSPHCSGRSL